MDAKQIKAQIAYWTSVENEMKARIKADSDTLKTVQATIKSLKTLLPKEKEVEVPDDLQGGHRVESLGSM